MSKIAVLPDLLINKIAAGEVIERPASVVRELIDNSIDAGASRIDVEVLYGGKKLIKVSDDGFGMDRADAELCFERHATSKIRTEEELFDISTLGFRGEAIPAIASVSKVTMITSTPDADVGIKVEIGVNHKPELSDAPPVKGTMIEIRDIFYNTPARRKFLKTNPTELSHIISTVVRKAFAYPSIAFTLKHNNSELLNAPSAGDHKVRLAQLYGDEMAGEFIEVRKEGRGITAFGFVSRPDVTRGSRSHQIIFVNKRPVTNATINHAVCDVYRDLIPGNRHPAYFIFLEVDPAMVDVNVHPAKREVKFERPDDIHRLVRAAVYEALNPGHEVNVTALPSFKGQARTGPVYRLNTGGAGAVQEPSALFGESQSDFFTSGMADAVSLFFYIGEAFVATVTEEGLMIIDQHAAHERINYEKFLKREAIETEPLFLPLRIELPVREYNIVIKQLDFLGSLGLDIDDFGKNNVIVRSIPKEIRKADIKGLIMDVAAGVIEEETDGITGESQEQALLKSIAARLACHRSVRGSEQLNNEELSKMMSDLEKADEPGKCPHGRPTKIMLSINDLQKMFKRT